MAIARRLKSTTEQPKIHHRRGKYTTLRLIQPYLGNGHTLFVDNYYTSQILFHDLYQLQTGAYGTMCVMGVPAELKTTKLKKGRASSAFRSKNRAFHRANFF